MAPFVFSIAACLIAAAASLLRGGRYHAQQATTTEETLRPAPSPEPARASVRF